MYLLSISTVEQTLRALFELLPTDRSGMACAGLCSIVTGANYLSRNLEVSEKSWASSQPSLLVLVATGVGTQVKTTRFISLAFLTATAQDDDTFLT